jgi:hypothetical protein
LVAIIVLASLSGVNQRPPLQLAKEPSATNFPAGAVDYLRASALDGKMFNEYHWGGYLISQLFPKQRVFVDGRADVYGDDFVERYMEARRLKPGWQGVLDEHDIQIVLVEKESPLAVALGDDPNWQEAYAGEVERLFLRRTP